MHTVLGTPSVGKQRELIQGPYIYNLCILLITLKYLQLGIVYLNKTIQENFYHLIFINM